MRYLEILPPPSLRGAVRCLWLLENPRDTRTVERVLPDGCVEVVVHYGAPMLRRLENGRHETQPGAVAAGQLRTAMQLVSTGPMGMVAARIEPWAAAPLLRETANALTSRVVPLDTIWGAGTRVLEERVRAAPDDQTRFHLLARAIETRLRPADEFGLALRQAVTWITETHGAIPVGEIAQRLQWSRRRLERAFSSGVGLSAKALCRVHRFRQIVAALHPDDSPSARRDPAPRLVDLAMDAGYADQAHMAREFKDLAGLPVTRYRAEQHQLSDCLTKGDSLSPLI